MSPFPICRQPCLPIYQMASPLCSLHPTFSSCIFTCHTFHEAFPDKLTDISPCWLPLLFTPDIWTFNDKLLACSVLISVFLYHLPQRLLRSLWFETVHLSSWFFVIHEIINDNKQLFGVLYFHSIVIRAVLIPTSNILEHGSLEKLRNLFMMTQIANLSWIPVRELCSGT